jgi:predicted ester cyclase
MHADALRAHVKSDTFPPAGDHGGEPPGRERSILAEEIKAVIRRLVDEVYNDNDLDVLDELVAQDIINHSAVLERQHGIEGFRHVNEWVRGAFSDVHYEIEGMIAEGDMGACHITVSGTQGGEFRGNPPPEHHKSGVINP